MNFLETLLLRLTIFLIPTNLAYHWYIEGGYHHGVLIDYLLPKLYLSDIPIIILLIIYGLRFVTLHKNFHLPSFLAGHNLLITLFLYLFMTSLLSPNPTAAIWVWFKFLEYVLFAFYLINNYSLASFKQALSLPLTASLLFQSIIGLLQYINQSSVFGYLLLGESTLGAAAAIAKDSFSGVLKLLPYGTTPHPNVLAGFITTGILLLLTLVTQNPKKNIFLVIKLITICLAILVLWLTQSQTALLSISISLLILISRRLRPLWNNTRSIYLAIFSTIIVIVIFGWVNYHSINMTVNDSIGYRYRLIKSNLQIFNRLPLTGTGLNQSIVTASTIDTITTPAPFFQPVHSIYLLWLTETGMIGAGLLLLLIWQARSRVQKRLNVLAALPLINLLIIGLLDHYPITLQTGQLLLLFAIIGLSVTNKTPS